MGEEYSGDFGGWHGDPAPPAIPMSDTVPIRDAQVHDVVGYESPEVYENFKAALEGTFGESVETLTNETKQLLSDLYVPTTAATATPASMRRLNMIVEPLLDASSADLWYMAANPAMMDTVEWAHLEGEEGVRIESLNGLFVETTLLSPVALGYLLFLGIQGHGRFLAGDVRTSVLLVLAGAVTALPLVWFTSGARRLTYTTVGLLQYLAPTLQFLLAVVVYGEPFTTVHLLTFTLIWAGLSIFMLDVFAHQRRGSRSAARKDGSSA